MALQHKHDEEEGEERPHHQQGQHHHHHHHRVDAANCVGGGGDVAGTPKFLPLLHVCTAASPCVGVSGSSNVMSKKVTARKLVVAGDFFRGADDEKAPPSRPPPLPIVHVYTRRLKRPRNSYERLSELPRPVKLENVELSADLGNCGGVQEDGLCSKKRRIGSSEVVKLRENSLALCNGSKLREVRSHINSNTGKRRKRSLGPSSTKKWIRLNFDGVDPKTFVGLQCKVYWPLDGDWYCGHIVGYNPDTSKHHVKYEDGDEEVLMISNEKIKFHASREDMQKLNFSTDNGNVDTDGLDYDEMVAMAANLDDCQDHEAGDIIWAKITGYAMWPAIIMDESLIGDRKGLNRMADGNSVAVQFFGTHDFARVKTKLVISFLRGLLSSLHLKCKKPHFLQSLEEAKLYLSEQKLPRRMLQIRKRIGSNYCESATMETEVINDSSEDCRGDGKKQITPGFSCSRFDSKPPLCKLSSRIHGDCPVGYRPVRVDWKDLDKCNVCHMDEEYVNNLFLQCDKCRMLVHAKCYGEVEPVDGVLWLCNLCRPGAPDSTPLCCLCPVIGGVMKPTVDGRWAHLACAIWIPETCLSDINKMEPIDGLSRISKDRWKLLCSICGVPYGACIQCSNNTCRVAYHPLCARAAGLCAELEDEDRLHLISLDDVDDENQCIRLLSFCKKHRQPANQHSAALERVGQTACKCSDYVPPLNPSGCARTEPFNNFGRRGRKAPEALAAASLKCLFVENRSYIISGCSQPESLGLTNALEASVFSHKLNMLKASEFDDPKIFSMDDKYKHMRKTFRSRLAFGKSGIHGFGIFAKHPHRAGDMVIEYTGELVRPSVADRREHFIYNSLVGAGTYMFRIDDDRVIDATRAGSIAHLINHSCEPNCYSRGICINGDEHIIIFAKRDIRQWEELTYDYRFFSVDEQLRCHCGFPRCRGIVNDIDAEERNAKLYVPRSKLMDWRGE